MFHRRALTRVLPTVPALLALTAAGLLGASPASAATGGPHLFARAATLELHAPAQTRPMTDDCFRGWSSALCGYGSVSLTLSGFSAVGGVPSCDPGEATYSDSCEEPVASLVETGGTKVDVVVKCAGKLLPRVASVPVVTEPSHLAGPADVSGFTRLDADSARVSVAFTLPTPSRIGVCGNRETRLLSASVRGVTVGWSGAEGTSVPAGTYRLPGTHRVRL
ncbi:hypothetical protein AB2L28_18980 [Kineococcus sp. TBRC 1896]|uniref:Uncharacterized protein n=1 Tax=Kineococcus mangrovi TaxID=1660183 RepID=A0ABV4I717_9ACTN